MDLSGYVYVCANGESFDSVALTYYGDETKAAELLCVNPEHCGKSRFDGGERLRLPVIDIPRDVNGDIVTAGDKAPWKE